MILARHKLNPPNEVMFAQMNINIKKYSNSFKDALSRIIKTETGFDPFCEKTYRGRGGVQARQLFMIMMFSYTKRTLRVIGNFVSKDHATVLHAIKAINDQYDTDKIFRAMYDRIDSKVKQLR